VRDKCLFTTRINYENGTHAAPPINRNRAAYEVFLPFLIRRFVLAAVTVSATAVAAAAGLSAQSPSGRTGRAAVSVWDGVYTQAQAVRGRQSYEQKCANCHRPDLRGANGRALVGPRFWQDWGEDTLNSLYAAIRSTMPRGEAGSLSDDTYADIVAYILQANEYPAGAADLTPASVAAVRVIGKDGPGPVPNFALVTVVGCLASQPGGEWTLTHATEPTRTRNPDPSKNEERDRSVALAPGTLTFGLMDVYASGDGHDGHRMEVKGLLIRGTRGAPDRVNTTGMQMLASQCAP
jgi:quinoprotein glucose dehydrogenase